MRQALLVSSSIFTLALGIPAAAQPPAGDVIEPALAGRLEPCCGNQANAYPPLKRHAADAMPDHSLFPPEETARRKKEAAVRPDLPPARRLATSSPSPEAKSVTRQALALRGQFEGLNIVQAGLSFPPDTIVAASATRVLEATNVALRLTGRDGGGALVRSLDDFFGLPTADSLHFDPKVYFDRLSERFYVADLVVDFTARASFIFLSVSRGSDPASLLAPQSWCNYRIPAKVGQSWADYPGLGMNERWLGVAVNNFNFGFGFRSAFVYALDKRELAANAAACPDADFFRFKAGQDAAGRIGFTVQPAQHYSEGSLAGTPLFFVSSSVTEGISRDYTLWRVIDRPAKGTPGLARDLVRGAENYTVPPNAPQRAGDELDTGDQRILQAAYRDGVVWAAHTTGCNFGFTPGESCARVVGIRPTDDGGAVAFEEIFGGGADWFVWMPGIAVNARGDLAVAFQRSRSTMSAGMAFAGKPAGSASFERLVRLVNGRCGLDNFDGQRNRTGDYVGIQTDPADDLSFWIAGEYSGNVGRFGCQWRTRVARIGF